MRERVIIIVKKTIICIYLRTEKAFEPQEWTCAWVGGALWAALVSVVGDLVPKEIVAELYYEK